MRSRVEESEVREGTRERMEMTDSSIEDVLANPRVLRRFGYLILLMTAFTVGAMIGGSLGTSDRPAAAKI